MSNFKKGSYFLVEETQPSEVFIPEEFSEEQRMFAKTAEDFVRKEVLPKTDEIENKNFEVHIALFKKAGELGLLGAEVPEEYGGLGLDKISAMLISEKICFGQGSFATTVMAHTGIGTLPIVYFGTEEQKQKWLPKLAMGELISAYALTETNAGSDAMNIKTKAVLDGDYWVLNGSKQFISNAGIADLFIVYAKVDGEHHAAFIIERNTEGFSVGPEEHKMGIRGSSTCPLYFDNAKVPKENLLGGEEWIGKGHLIAFNILNIGRYKLGMACVGNSKFALEEATKYANQRQQFGKPISSFDMIKEKIARMATRAWVLESAAYRTAGLLDAGLSVLSEKSPIEAISEYAVECSILKVFGSEILDTIVDDMVQIYGGYGYTEEYPAARAYRDSRINRIFEGTNEINRLVIIGMLARKAMKGELPLIQAATQVGKEIMTLMPMSLLKTGFLAEEKLAVDMARKLILMVAGITTQKFKDQLRHEQIIVENLADMIIELFAMESALLRALKIAENKGEEKARYQAAMTKYYFAETFPKLALYATKALCATESGDTLRTQLSIVRKLTRWYVPSNIVELIRTIADKVIEEEKYCF